MGKTTVYRRWGTPGALAADLLDDMAAQSLPRARTGSVDEDLRENARLVVRTLTDLRQVRLFKALIAASLCDEHAARALHGFYSGPGRGGGSGRRAPEWGDGAVERRAVLPPKVERTACWKYSLCHSPRRSHPLRAGSHQ